MIGAILAHLDFLEEQIDRLSEAIEKQLGPTGLAGVALANTITGVARRTAEVMLAEIGTDMSVFASARHLASWAGRCPGNDESAGKRRSGRTRKGSKWLGIAMQEAALAAVRSKNTYLAAQYQRLKPRIGHGRALGAVKHSMLIAYWHMFSTGETYRDLGGDYFQRRDPARATKRLVRKLEALGHIVIQSAGGSTLKDQPDAGPYRLVKAAGGGGELVEAFDARAIAIAAMAASANTRRAYASAYRAFAGFLRAHYGEASRDTVMIASVAAWRDELAAQGLAASSITQRVSAVRRLAATLGADPLVQQVRCTHVQRDEPRALSDVELERLLRHPDRRTVIGVRDRAILELLARAGLSRAELARLTVADIQERGRQPDARRRTVIAPGRTKQTRLEVVIRASKRGRTRTVPLHAEAHDALARWYASRPGSASDALFVSLRQRRSAQSEAISASAAATASSSTPPAPACVRTAAPHTRSGTRSARCSPNVTSR